MKKIQIVGNKPFQVVWGNIDYIPNTELCFCCSVGKTEHCEVHIIAKDIYNLYVNGQFVCYGPARAAKGYCRVDKIELDSVLTKEINLICVYVQSNYTGSLSFCLETPLFGTKIYSNEQIIKQTSDFDCYLMTDHICKTERMSSQRGFCEVYECNAPREKNDFSYYQRLDVKEVSEPKIIERRVGFSKNTVYTYKKMQSGYASCKDDEEIKKQYDSMGDFGEDHLGYSHSDCDILINRELLSFDYSKPSEKTNVSYTVYEAEVTHCGKIQICIAAVQDTTIWVIYDDLLIDNVVQFNREHITHGLKWKLKQGTYSLHSGEVYSAKYIQIISDNPITVESVSVIGIENGDCEGFVIPPMKEALKKIVAAAQNTFKQNAYDILTDCPCRERAGWLCDSYFIGKAEHFFTGDNKVEKNMLENYLLYKNESFTHDGIIPMCYPSYFGNVNNNIPGWTLWYVLELEDYYKRNSDDKFISLHYKRLNDILDYFKTFENEYGMIENLEGWLFVEWSKASDFIYGVNIPYNILYAEALRACGVLTKKEALIEKSAKTKALIINMAYNGTVFVDNLIRKDNVLVATQNYSELCQIFAAYFDMLPRDKKFKHNFINRFKNTDYQGRLCPTAIFIGAVLRIMTLYNMSEYKLFLDECEKIFAPMANSTGTLWEFSDKGASCNHGFGAILGMLICRYSKEEYKTGDIYEKT